MIRYFPLALCLLVFPASAEMYKWTDENGKVHYSDQQPPSSAKKTETIQTPKPAAAPATPSGDGSKPSAAPRTPAEQEMQFKRRRLEAAEAEIKGQKEAQSTEEKKRNCQRAKDQVTSFERGGRVARPGSDGAQIYMQDKEIAQALVEARKIADSWCK